MPVSFRPTPAQNGAGAADISVHMPATAARQTFVGDAEEPYTATPARLAQRPTYRASTGTGPAPFPDFGETTPQIADVHAQPGPVNPRQVWQPEGMPQAGNPGTPARQYQAIRDDWQQNVQEIGVPASAGTISLDPRPRAGGTSADNTRVAKRNTAYFLRPFDKRHADRFMTPRYALSSPTASRPLTFRAPVAGGGYPSQGGGAASPGLTPIGVRGSIARSIPQPWDEYLVPDNQAGVDVSANHAAAVRAAGWRGR